MNNRKISGINKSSNGIASAIKSIRQAFGFNEAELAMVSGAQSSLTMSRWCDGSVTPDDDELKRLMGIEVIALEWVSRRLTADVDLLHMPVIGPKSIFFLLIDDEVDAEEVLLAGSQLVLS